MGTLQTKASLAQGEGVQGRAPLLGGSAAPGQSRERPHSGVWIRPSLDRASARDEAAGRAIQAMQAKMRRGPLNTTDLFNGIKSATHGGTGDLCRQLADLRAFVAAHGSRLSLGAQALFDRFSDQVQLRMECGGSATARDLEAIIDDLRQFMTPAGLAGPRPGGPGRGRSQRSRTSPSR